jgi:hypothetical protein
LIDAVIAISVIYKGFDNLDGFRRWFETNQPNLLAMVFGFGLIHGFGLARPISQNSPAYGTCPARRRWRAPGDRRCGGRSIARSNADSSAPMFFAET